MCSLRAVKICFDVKGHTALILTASESSIMDISGHSNFQYLKRDSFEIAVVQDVQNLRKFG